MSERVGLVCKGPPKSILYADYEQVVSAGLYNGERVLLPDGLVDNLTSVSLRLKKDTPFSVQHLELEII